MKRLVALLAALCALPADADVWNARYGVAETFNFPLFNADGSLDVDEADGGTEVSLSCNEGAETTATNDFADEGNFYSIALTATEMECERIAVVIAATTTHVFFIATVGNASAFTPFVPADVQQVSGDGTAADNLELAFDDTAGAVPWLGITDQGTAQSATGTTLVLRAATPFSSDDANLGSTLWAHGSTQGYWQARAIKGYVTSTDTATVDTWDVTPSGTITYKVIGTAPGSSTDVNVASVTDGALVVADFHADAILTPAEAQTAAAAALEQLAILDANLLNCTVDTANFAGSTTTLACDLTDRDGAAITSNIATGDMTGRGIEITSGAQRYEFRFFNSTTWDGTNNELQLTLSRALPATLADAVTAIIR
jgi:hypothetical protein